MLIFIDTEFTDFKDAELISIGLVTEDGSDEFYAELPVDQSKCNDFVLVNVLSQLEKTPGAQCTRDQLAGRLSEWLRSFESRAPIVICYDYEGDWRLFGNALGSAIPAGLVGKNIYRHIDQQALQQYFVENGLRDHHALNDARANRFAYDPSRGT